MRFKTLFNAATLVLCTAAAQATTVPLAADGSWYAFDVDLVGSGTSSWIDVAYTSDFSNLSFTVTVPAGLQGLLTVVDGGFAGELYTVTVNGVVQPAMSAPGVPGANAFIDFDAALADPAFSRGQYVLGAGLNTITGFVNAPGDVSVGGLRVSLVPEPATWATLVGGLLWVSALARRRG